MDNLPKLWTSIKADLGRARDLLPGFSEEEPSLARYYDEFLEHNELELACNTLEESAKHRAASREFWLALRAAAQKMRLEDNVARYKKFAEKP